MHHILRNFLFIATLCVVLFYCNADQLSTSHQSLHQALNTTNTTSTKRSLESQTYSGIRISFDYQGMASMDATKQSFVKNYIMPAIADYFKAAIQVVPRKTAVVSSVLSCAGFSIPLSLYTTGVSNTDLVVVVSSSDQPGVANMGTSAGCILDSTTYRPIVGVLNINEARVSTDESRWMFQFGGILHLMMHILLFDSRLPYYYINSTSGTFYSSSDILSTKEFLGVQTRYLTLPKFIEKAKEYYSCSSMTGFPLEQQGGSSVEYSHFERRVIVDEILAPGFPDVSNARVSALSFVLFEDSGWYKMNPSFIEPTIWGKMQGCDFLDEPCISNGKATSDVFCTDPKSTSKCTYDRKAVGFCSSSINPSLIPYTIWDYFNNGTVPNDPYSDNCPYATAYSDYYCTNTSRTSWSGVDSEVFGSSSSCFEGTLLKQNFMSDVTQSAYCFQYQCVLLSSSPLSYKLLINLGSNSVSCYEAGNVTVGGHTGVLYCPDPNVFCQTIPDKFCRYGCGGHGTCESDLTCTCDEGFKKNEYGCTLRAVAGDDSQCKCSYPKTIFDYKGDCVCPNGDCSTLPATPPSSYCSSCIPNCLSCSSITTCTLCENGYTVSNGACVQCEHSCLSCDMSDLSICLTCAAGYLFYNNKCITTCPIGYYPNSTHCLKCDAGCTSCIGPSICLTCSENYYLSEARCLPMCPTGPCTACSDPYYCTSCIPGYYLLDGVCHPCLQTASCLACSSATACTNCAPGYYLANGICTACASGCASCEDSTSCATCATGYYHLSTTAAVCEACISPCLTCTSSTVCTSCVNGYVLVGSTCLPMCSTLENCALCGTDGTCQACNSGYYLASGNCFACGPNCLTCNNSTTCQVCDTGYFLDSTSTICQQCNLDCYTCELQPSRCTSCIIKSILIGNKCYSSCQDDPNCVNCGASGTCLACTGGYRFDPELQKCVACPTANCEVCDSATLSCSACQQSYYLNSDDNTCIKCPDGCQICSSSTNCLTCESPYQLSHGVCVTSCVDVSNCNSCYLNNTCFECASGYSYDQYYNCKTCQAANCQLCSKSNYLMCAVCNAGYFADTTGFCQTCATGCSKCSVSAGNCTSCSTGYYLYPTSTSTTCQQCPLLCLTCTSATDCQSCISGYYLTSQGTCQACSSHCSSCHSYSECLTCNDGYVLVNSFCKSTSNVCAAGEYYLDGACYSCSKGCDECSDSSTCTSCVSGYFKDSTGQCTRCSGNCNTCLSATHCVTCVGGTQFDATTNTCKKVCPLGCSVCTDDGTCTHCQSGKYLYNELCHSCPSSCSNCVFSTTSNQVACSQCYSGYILQSDTKRCVSDGSSGGGGYDGGYNGDPSSVSGSAGVTSELIVESDSSANGESADGTKGGLNIGAVVGGVVGGLGGFILILAALRYRKKWFKRRSDAPAEGALLRSPSSLSKLNPDVEDGSPNSKLNSSNAEGSRLEIPESNRDGSPPNKKPTLENQQVPRQRPGRRLDPIEGINLLNNPSLNDLQLDNEQPNALGRGARKNLIQLNKIKDLNSNKTNNDSNPLGGGLPNAFAPKWNIKELEKRPNNSFDNPNNEDQKNFPEINPRNRKLPEIKPMRKLLDNDKSKNPGDEPQQDVPSLIGARNKVNFVPLNKLDANNRTGLPKSIDEAGPLNNEMKERPLNSNTIKPMRKIVDFSDPRYYAQNADKPADYQKIQNDMRKEYNINELKKQPADEEIAANRNIDLDAELANPNAIISGRTLYDTKTLNKQKLDDAQNQQRNDDDDQDVTSAFPKGRAAYDFKNIGRKTDDPTSNNLNKIPSLDPQGDELPPIQGRKFYEARKVNKKPQGPKKDEKPELEEEEKGANLQAKERKLFEYKQLKKNKDVNTLSDSKHETNGDPEGAIEPQQLPRKTFEVKQLTRKKGLDNITDTKPTAGLMEDEDGSKITSDPLVRKGLNTREMNKLPKDQTEITDKQKIEENSDEEPVEKPAELPRKKFTQKTLKKQIDDFEEEEGKGLPQNPNRQRKYGQKTGIEALTDVTVPAKDPTNAFNRGKYSERTLQKRQVEQTNEDKPENESGSGEDSNDESPVRKEYNKKVLKKIVHYEDVQEIDLDNDIQEMNLGDYEGANTKNDLLQGLDKIEDVGPSQNEFNNKDQVEIEINPLPSQVLDTGRFEAFKEQLKELQQRSQLFPEKTRNFARGENDELGQVGDTEQELQKGTENEAKEPTQEDDADGNNNFREFFGFVKVTDDDVMM